MYLISFKSTLLNFSWSQGMLSEFIVNELKHLLRKAGQSQRGKKAELFQRANELLRHGSPKILHQIHEIYYTTRPYRTAKHISPARAKAHLKKQMAQRRSREAYVVHPDVKFKPHPFFRPKTTIIRPTALGLSTVLCVSMPPCTVSQSVHIW